MTWDPTTVSHAEAVARLFPELSLHGVKMERGIPGRYWPSDAVPERPTKLDRRIIELRDGLTPRKRIRKPEVLMEGGIACAVYAARVYALIGWSNANADARAFSPERVKEVTTQRDALDRMIGGMRAVLACDPEWTVRSGNPRLDPNDPKQENAEREGGQAYHAALRADLPKHEARFALVRSEADRLEKYGNPKIWDQSFFLGMGNLWNLLTGQLPAVNSGGPFTKFLDAAIYTIRGDDSAHGHAWGVGDGLLTEFKDSGPGVGFRIGETGEWSLESIHQVASRGPDMRAFLKVAGEDMGAMAAAVVALRDYSEGPCQVLMRELVLRPPLRSGGLLPPIVRAQLGWLYTVDPKGIRAAARSAIEMAQRGNELAITAVELARRAQVAAGGRQTEWGERYDIAWPKAFSGRDPRDVRYGLLAHGGESDLLSCALLGWPSLWPEGSLLLHEGLTR